MVVIRERERKNHERGKEGRNGFLALTPQKEIGNGECETGVRER